MRFASPRDVFFLAPRIRNSIGNFIFNTFFFKKKKFAEIIKSEKSYTTVRPAPLKDVLVKGAGIGAVISFYTF